MWGYDPNTRQLEVLHSSLCAVVYGYGVADQASLAQVNCEGVPSGYQAWNVNRIS